MRIPALFQAFAAGVLVAARDVLNFTGAGVTVTDDAANGRINVAISGAPSGAAGGDLAGTYPNPTVSDLTIANEAEGDLLRRKTNIWQRLGIGAPGQVLQCNTTPEATWTTKAPCFQVDATGALSDLTKLWSYHPLSEVIGTRLDMLGRVPLTQTGSVPAVVAGGPASADLACLDAPGSGGNYLSCLSGLDWWSGGTAFTVSIWFRLDALPGAGAYATLISRRNTPAGAGWALFAQNTAGTTNLISYFSDGATTDELRHGTALAVNTWYHAVLTFDGTDRRLYLDGGGVVTDAPTVNPGTPDATCLFALGTFDGAQHLLDGRLAHLAMWRGYAAPAARVAELFNAGAPNRLRY